MNYVIRPTFPINSRSAALVPIMLNCAKLGIALKYVFLEVGWKILDDLVREATFWRIRGRSGNFRLRSASW